MVDVLLDDVLRLPRGLHAAGGIWLAPIIYVIWYVMDARDGTRMGSPTNNREQQNVCVQ